MSRNQQARDTADHRVHFDLDSILHENVRNVRGSGIRELLKLTESPDIISFAGGIPDPAVFPFEEIEEAFEKLRHDRSLFARGLQYSSIEGYPPLRDWIARHMRRIGVDATRENILVTSGSQQALDLCARMLLKPGDRLAVEAPTYLGALQAFSVHAPHYTKLDRHIEPNHRLAYVVPEYSNPTGHTWPALDRRELIASLGRSRTFLIEDAAYHSLGFSGGAHQSLQALDSHADGLENVRTIFCGTFSKTYVPGFRLGWVCAPVSIIDKLTLLKQGCDLNSSALAQMLLVELLLDGYEARLDMLRLHYRRRRDLMLSALAAHMPAEVKWNIPEGGLFVWLTLPREIDADRLLEHAVRKGVGYVPGSAFYAVDVKANTIRLSYSSADLDTIDEGIRKLAVLLGDPPVSAREPTARIPLAAEI